ncbi:hypothetical protein [Priestia megaterium]|uniref:hypothetical protein n=1 Tax=Priestia megaterium TaxID=1404 RepID=UPI002FFF6C9E
MNLQTMTDQFDWLSILTYPATAIGGGLVGGLLLLAIQTFLKKGITHEFDKSMQSLKQNHEKTLADIRHEYDKRLSSFNADIAKEVDKETRDFQRKIHDFSLYSTKKHEIYPELFKQLYSLQYNISYVEKYSQSGSLLDKTSQILKYLESIGFTLNESTKKGLDMAFDTIKDDKNKLREKLKYIIKMDLLFQLRIRYSSVEVLFQSNMIYMSDEVSKKILDFLELLSLSIVNQTLSGIGNEIISTNDYAYKGIYDDMDKGIKEVKDLLKNELSIGYYEG